jgi:hypothetical protein
VVERRRGREKKEKETISRKRMKGERMKRDREIERIKEER